MAGFLFSVVLARCTGDTVMKAATVGSTAGRDRVNGRFSVLGRFSCTCDTVMKAATVGSTAGRDRVNDRFSILNGLARCTAQVTQ